MGNEIKNAVGNIWERVKDAVIPGYGKATGQDVEKANLEEQVANKNAQSAANKLREQYNLNDNQIALILPLLTQTNGKITSEILQYVNEMTAAQQTLDYNSYANQAAMQRAAGINPDLNGIEQGSGQIPGAATTAGTVEQSANSGGACKQKAMQVTSVLMQAAQLGLNAFKIITDIQTAGATAGITAAGVDLLSLTGDENGIVQDVQSQITNLVNGRTFRNKAERQAYIQEVTKRMNAVDIATKRLQIGTEYHNAKLDNAVAKYKGSEEYIKKATKLVSAKMDIDVLAAEYDNEIAERNYKFLQQHPEYNEAQLKAELEQANTQAAQANARRAESEAKVAENTEQAQIRKANADAREAEANADTAESNRDVTKLRNENEKTLLKFLGEMQNIIISYESDDINTWYNWEERRNKDLAGRTQQYKEAKKYYRKHTEGEGRTSLKVGLGKIGSIGIDM